MIRFLEGPAHDVGLALRRGPRYLRVVVDAAGKVDALDQLDDTPAGDELVYVYRADVPTTTMHILRRPLKGSGFYASGVYTWMPDVDGEQLRDNEAWRAWAKAQPGYDPAVAETVHPIEEVSS